MADTKNTSTSLLPEITSQNKRMLAKAGMAAALGTLVATGLMETSRTETLKKIGRASCRERVSSPV